MLPPTMAKLAETATGARVNGETTFPTWLQETRMQNPRCTTFSGGYISLRKVPWYDSGGHFLYRAEIYFWLNRPVTWTDVNMSWPKKVRLK